MQRLAIQAEKWSGGKLKELQLRKLQAAAGKLSVRKSNNVHSSESSGAQEVWHVSFHFGFCILKQVTIALMYSFDCIYICPDVEKQEKWKMSVVSNPTEGKRKQKSILKRKSSDKLKKAITSCVNTANFCS